MDYRKELFPLNHFLLWCKGWYTMPKTKEDVNEDLFEVLKSVLALDNYSTHYMTLKDFTDIILNCFEKYNLWCFSEKLNYVRMTQFFDTVNRYESYSYNRNAAIIMAVRVYFQGLEKGRYCLKKPVYSKKLFKKYGLIIGNLFSSPKKGMTYKEMNHEADGINWDASS